MHFQQPDKKDASSCRCQIYRSTGAGTSKDRPASERRELTLLRTIHVCQHFVDVFFPFLWIQWGSWSFLAKEKLWHSPSKWIASIYIVTWEMCPAAYLSYPDCIETNIQFIVSGHMCTAWYVVFQAQSYFQLTALSPWWPIIYHAPMQATVIWIDLILHISMGWSTCFCVTKIENINRALALRPFTLSNVSVENNEHANRIDA